jgi:hypothetical protein
MSLCPPTAYDKCFGRSFVFLRRASSPFAPHGPEWISPTKIAQRRYPPKPPGTQAARPANRGPFLFFPSDPSSPSIQNIDKEVRASLRRRRSLQPWRTASLQYQPPVPASTNTAEADAGEDQQGQVRPRRCSYRHCGGRRRREDNGCTTPTLTPSKS